MPDTQKNTWVELWNSVVQSVMSIDDPAARTNVKLHLIKRCVQESTLRY